ncbi:TonB-dependent receptor [Pseudoalteromonas sp. B160]
MSELTYRLETDFGEFRLRSQTTYMIEVLEDIYFGGPSQDYKGHPGYPKWRSQFELGYNIDNLSVNWVTDAIASTGMVSAPVINADGSILNESTGNRPTYITHNVTAAYDFDKFGRVTVGARNIFDKGILRDDNDNWIDNSLYIRGHYGRELFARYSIKF